MEYRIDYFFTAAFYIDTSKYYKCTCKYRLKIINTELDSKSS